MATDKKSTSKSSKSKEKVEDKGVTRAEAEKAAQTSKAAAPASKAKAKPKAASAKQTTKPEGASAKKPKKAAVAPTRNRLVSKCHYEKNYEPQWHVVDAKGVVLGRLSSQIAKVLMGKHRPQFTRGADCGDFVVVINAEKVKLTGKKLTNKWYHYHTHHMGGIKSFTPSDLFEKHPERVIERAVYGMLPKGHLGRQWYKRLRVYAGPEHPHKAQQPKLMTAAQDR
ncbi:MAG: 50S ribosomal protein L13 [Bdellovibrionales bacterium]|nr:50S ribosomal protein L13 [Bdellovibrionales bacterium]